MITFTLNQQMAPQFWENWEISNRLLSEIKREKGKIVLLSIGFEHSPTVNVLPTEL